MELPAAPPPLVLIADNDVGVNALLADILADRGLTCESVHDGEAAWARLQAGGVDVLVTDLDMPRLDGRELIRRLSQLSVCPATVVISGFMDRDFEATLDRHPGVRHVLRKPFDVLRFADLVAAAVPRAEGPTSSC
jgi:CheY-like chemotaxis protein